MVCLLWAGLSACSLTGGGRGASYSVPVTDPPADAAPMADFLSAHLADNIDDLHAASIYYGRLYRDDPSDAYMLERAVWAHILAGKIEEAIRLAHLAPADTLGDSPTASLVRAVDSLAAGETEDARIWLDGQEQGPFNGLAASGLVAWIDFASGKEASATTTTPIGHLRSPVLSNRAFLHFAHGRRAEALAAFNELWQMGVRSEPLALAHMALLRSEGAHHGIGSLAASFRTDLRDSPRVARFLERPEAVVTPPDWRQGAALSLYVIAKELLERSGEEFALLYAFLSLLLDADLDASRLVIIDALAASGRIGEAQELLDKIGEKDIYRASIEARRAVFLYRQEKEAEAIIAVRKAVAADPDRDTAFRMVKLYQAMGEHSSAEPLLDALIAEDAKAGITDWRILYTRGQIKERLSGKWAEARIDLQKALALKPGQPDILNYFGYSLIDRNENIDQAFAMIKSALVQRPRAGYIVDSLGWAYFRLRRYEQAVRHLEDATALTPADPVINSHLGDAYWKVGRQRDARAQWRRAQDFNPDSQLVGELRRKLANGFDASDSARPP